jgi:hypothetical protein
VANIGDVSYCSNSGDSLYIEGEVKLVKADEFGAETKRSCGETVPTCGEPAGECIWYGSYIVGTAGDENADGNMVLLLFDESR